MGPAFSCVVGWASGCRQAPFVPCLLQDGDTLILIREGIVSQGEKDLQESLGALRGLPVINARSVRVRVSVGSNVTVL